MAQTSDMLELTASYPAAVVGLDGSSPVAVDLVLASDGSLKATYAASTGNATSATTITPDPGQDRSRSHPLRSGARGDLGVGSADRIRDGEGDLELLRGGSARR